MVSEDKKGFISCDYDKIDLIDTPYQSKLENGVLFIQFNFYNISNIEVTEDKKWSLFSGNKYKYNVKIYETFYTNAEKKTFVSTTIEFDDINVKTEFLEKLSKKVEEFQTNNKPLLLRDKKIILSLKAFQDIKRISFEAERQIAKTPYYINIHKGILKFKLDKYDIEDSSIDFLRKEFNFIKELELEDLYIEEDEIHKKTKHIVAKFNTKHDLYNLY